MAVAAGAGVAARTMGAGPVVLLDVLRGVGRGDAGRLRVAYLPGRSADHGARRDDAVHAVQLHRRYRHDCVARGRRLRAGRGARGAARHPDGRVQGGRGLLRAVRFVLPLPAGLGFHSAADPVGRHRRDAEAAGDLHRLVFPDRADGGGRRGRRAQGPGGSRLHAGRQQPRHRQARADSGRCAGDCRDPAAGAGLGVDLRDRRRADRLVLGHRPYDYRQPGAAEHRQIIFGIIVIGCIGLVSDLVFKQANQRLFPWSSI